MEPRSNTGNRCPCRAARCWRSDASRAPASAAYLAVRGSFDLPEYLGSRATFTLGQFGGHGGRALRTGDVLRLNRAGRALEGCQAIAPEQRPDYGAEWRIRVNDGPHGAPDFFTPEDIETFYATDWEVHYNSSRTGVRLIGPKPRWARADGGEAGLHPSNIHDNAYAIGSIDYTGDMPVILGPDGPSLGGFVCPATIVEADLWKLGQLKPGDKLRFQRVPKPERACRQPGGVARPARLRDARRGVRAARRREQCAGRVRRAPRSTWCCDSRCRRCSRI